MATKNVVVESILKAEKKVDELINSAKQESLKIISTAEDQSAQIKASSQETIKKRIKQQTEINENKSLLEHENSLREYSESAEEIEKRASANYNKAIDVIINKITKQK